MKPPSQRFTASKTVRIFVPIVITLLSLGLLAILVAVVLAVAGIIPAA